MSIVNHIKLSIFLAAAGAILLTPAHALLNGVLSSQVNGLRASTVAIETPEGLCTVIGAQFILTAAHCVAHKGRYRVHYLDKQFKPLTMSVQRVAHHPNFDPDDGFSAEDIGLIQTRQAFPEGMIYAKMPSWFKFSTDGDQVVIAGFGSTERKNARDGILREAPMKAVPPSISKTSFAGLMSEGSVKVGMCVGDSGGPVYKADSMTIIGILKGGTTEPNQECTVNPIFTPVRPYLTWIKMVAERWGVTIGE
jgi:Trypsin